MNGNAPLSMRAQQQARGQAAACVVLASCIYKHDKLKAAQLYMTPLPPGA